MENTDGITVTVMNLRSGDVLYHPIAGSYMYIAQGPHPIWSHLRAVVWCSPRGELSIDALDPRQEMPAPVINRDKTPEQRASQFRQWYLERAQGR